MSGIRWAAILMPTVPKDHLEEGHRLRSVWKGSWIRCRIFFFRADEEEKMMIYYVFMSYLILSTYNHVYKYVYIEIYRRVKIIYVMKNLNKAMNMKRNLTSSS